MPPLVLEVLYCVSSALTGSAATGWLCWSRSHRKGTPDSNADGHRAADVLARLHDLATRVAVDVDDHSNQVKEISDTLTSAGGQEPGKIVDVVAKLIQANQQMQVRLTSTEDRLREQAQQMQAHVVEARTDALTLLANRRAFDDELARRFAEFRRQGRKFSLTMVDVDHFKKFNDTHGHQAGDEVLRTVARLLRRKMREMDVVARYGGEEFVIIHPGTSPQDACRAAMRAREAVEKAQITFDGKELRVTASLGVAELMDGEDAAALVARADKALYACKAGGRNCVHWHDGQTTHRVEFDRESAPAAADPRQQSTPAPSQQETEQNPKPAQNADAGRIKHDLPSMPPPSHELPGRTLFCQQVRSRMSEWKRGGPTFSVALIEVNQYDQNGGSGSGRMHEFTTLAATRYLLGTIRDMDVLGHYGPGCFALMLPTAGLADAIRVAERLREGFAQASASAPDEQPRLTFSVSVVQATEKDDSISLLTRAEAALDVADRRGGNRAYYHDGERCAPITAMLETMGYLA